MSALENSNLPAADRPFIHFIPAEAVASAGVGCRRAIVGTPALAPVESRLRQRHRQRIILVQPVVSFLHQLRLELALHIRRRALRSSQLRIMESFCIVR